MKIPFYLAVMKHTQKTAPDNINSLGLNIELIYSCAKKIVQDMADRGVVVIDEDDAWEVEQYVGMKIENAIEHTFKLTV
jgi:hypothetical protein